MRVLPLAIAVACTASVSCIFHAGDTCNDDACLADAANQPPLAVIRGVDSAGQLRVGARTTIRISAADSTDPDADALTYSWSVSAACSANVAGATDAVELQLEELTADMACDVTLVVSDGRTASDTSAQLVIRDVGGYVSEVSPCAAAYDGESDAPQGTAAMPFCRLVDGLFAAADYQLGELRIAGVQTLAAPLVIDRGITLRGGWTRVTDVWTAPIPAGRSLVALGTSGGVDATLYIQTTSTADTVRLEGLAVYRTAPCNSECALVDAIGSNVVLQAVDLGSGPTGNVVVSTAAPNSIYYSVRAAGVAGQASKLAVQDTTIVGARGGPASVGIFLRDGLDATIAGTTITEKRRGVSGVRLVSAGNVRLQGVVMDVQSDAMTDNDARRDDSIAIGLADGNSAALNIGGCAPEPGRTCGGSRGITVTDTRITASHARLAAGVVGMGTRTLVFEGASAGQRSQLDASGREAYGLVTLDTGSVIDDVRGLVAQGLTVNVTSSTTGGLPLSAAIGWSDGYEAGTVTDAVVTLGSARPLVTTLTANVTVESQAVNEASGVVLRDTRGADVSDVDVTIDSSGAGLPINGFTADRATGVRLMRTSNTTINGGNVSMGSIEASWLAGGLVDGVMSLANDDIAMGPAGDTYGSSLVIVNGMTFDAVLSVHRLNGNPPLRTCVGLFGTRGGRFTSQGVGCRLGTSTAEPDPSMAGIITVLTREITVSESNVLLTAAAPTASVRLIGIQDGSRIADDRGSYGLRLTRNQIDINAVSSLAAAIRLSGAYVDPAEALAKPVIADNNVLRLAQSSVNIGVLAVATGAIAAFNSIRVAPCTVTNCAAAWATGFYLQAIAATNPVRILGNGFGVRDASFTGSGATPFAIEQTLTNDGPYVSAVVDNTFGREQPDSAIGFFRHIINATMTELQSPVGGAALTQAQLATTGATAVGNLDGAPVYCADGIHGDPAGPQADVVRNITSAMLDQPNLADIDGEARVVTADDAGADKLGPCPL